MLACPEVEVASLVDEADEKNGKTDTRPENVTGKLLEIFAGKICADTLQRASPNGENSSRQPPLRLDRR